MEHVSRPSRHFGNHVDFDDDTWELWSACEEIYDGRPIYRLALGIELQPMRDGSFLIPFTKSVKIWLKKKDGT